MALRIGKSVRSSIILGLTAVIIFGWPLSPVAGIEDKLNAAKDLEKLIMEYHSCDRFIGVVMIKRAGETICSVAVGTAVYEWNIPNDLETKFRIASLTKQFTAALILQLAAEGKLTLQDNIHRFLPDYREDIGSRVTLHHLLTHTSGIPDFTNIPGFWQDSVRNHYTPDYIVEVLCGGDLKFEPGTKFQYCNAGYYLLGRIIEAVEKKPYEAVLDERILQPLGLHNTGYELQKWVIPRLATGYHHRIWGIEKARYYYSPNFHSAGALYSTAGDLARWTMALHSGQVLPDSLYGRMITPNLNGYGYGIGIIRMPRPGSDNDSLVSIHHMGGIIGFDSFVGFLPEDEYTIILLSNVNTQALMSMYRGVIEILYGTEPSTSPTKPVAPELYRIIVDHSADSALQLYTHLREKDNGRYDLSKGELIRLGYGLLDDSLVSEARRVFHLTIDCFPDYDNAYDSYAEASLIAGDTAAAIENYSRALELNPDNTHARAILNELGVE